MEVRIADSMMTGRSFAFGCGTRAGPQGRSVQW
jgi:hypothetical protein